MWKSLAVIGDSEFSPGEVDTLKKNKTKSRNTVLRKDAKSFKNLPEDICFNILVKVEARHLQENVRLVCKAWKRMISTSPFIAQNATQAKPKLFIQGIKSIEPPSFMIKVLELVEERLDYRLHDFELCTSSVRIRSSCNGLLLLSGGRKKGTKGVLEVKNLATKRCVTLPLCPSCCPHKICGAALGFDPLTKKYKVVHVYADLFGFEIFTLGGFDNTWKRVRGPWKEPSERPFGMDFDWTNPILTNNRFLHWFVCSGEYVLSMDVSDEKFVRIRLPNCCKKIDRDEYGLMEVDGNLSLVHKVSKTQIDVWLLEDFHGQAWFKKHSIVADLTMYTAFYDSSLTKKQNGFPNLSKLVPLGSTGNGEVLMFKYEISGTDFRFYLYDTKRREMKKFKLAIRNVQPLIPHRSTLYHWKTLE